MSKLIGKKVRILNCDRGSACACVGHVGVVRHVSLRGNRLNVYNIDNNESFSGFYDPHQLRYLNNRPVVLP